MKIRMSTEHDTTHITPAGGNVFVDLGFEPAEAAALKAKSEHDIMARLVVESSKSNEPNQAPGA